MPIFTDHLGIWLVVGAIGCPLIFSGIGWVVVLIQNRLARWRSWLVRCWSWLKPILQECHCKQCGRFSIVLHWSKKYSKFVCAKCLPKYVRWGWHHEGEADGPNNKNQ